MKARLLALFDNFFWFVLLFVAGVIVFSYKKDPQISLLWALMILGLTNAVILILVYSKVRAHRTPSLHTKHRFTTEEHYEKAFKTGKEVLIVSIMSEHSLKNIRRHLEAARATNTKVKVLAFDPDIDLKMAKSMQLHLNESSNEPEAIQTEAIKKQIEAAWKGWNGWLEDFAGVITVHKYKSLPTMTAVLVKDDYISIELLPYHADPKERPGIFLTKKDDPDLFNLFQEKFSDLWDKQILLGN